MGVVKSFFQPQALNDPRATANNSFAGLLNGSLNGGGQDIGALLAQLGTLPGFNGQLTTDVNPAQTQALNASSQALQSFLSGNGGQNILAQLAGVAGQGSGLNVPSQLASLLGPSSNLSGIAGGQNSLMAQIQQLAGGSQSGIINLLTGQQNLGQSGSDAISKLLGGFNNSALSQLGSANFASPQSSLLQALGQGGLQNNYISQLGQGPSALSGLLGLNTASPEQTMLQQLAASGSNPYIQQLASGTPGVNQLLRLGSSGGNQSGQNTLQSLLGGSAASNLLGGGNTPDLNTLGQMLQTAAQPGISSGLRDLREQFSFNGLRKSTDVNNAASQFLTNSQSALTGQLAQIAPQLAGQQSSTSLGALQSLISGAGQLGSNQSQTLAQQIQALTSGGNLAQTGVQGASSAQNQQLGTLGQILGQAGQLGQSSVASQIQALLGGGNLQQQGTSAAADQTSQLNAQTLQALTQAGTLNQGGQQLNLQALLGGSSDAINQLQAMISGQSQAGNLATSGQQNVLQALLGAGNLGQIGQSNSLAALQSLLGVQAGAAGQEAGNTTNQAQILASLFGNQQSNSLQALLAQPNALSTISQLPNILAGQTSGLAQPLVNQQQQNIQNLFSGFQQQQSLIPQLLGYLSGTGPTQYAPSGFSQLLSGINSGVGAITGVDALKLLGQSGGGGGGGGGGAPQVAPGSPADPNVTKPSK